MADQAHLTRRKARFTSGQAFVFGFVITVLVCLTFIFAAFATGWHGYPGWGGLFVIGTFGSAVIGGVVVAILNEGP